MFDIAEREWKASRGPRKRSLWLFALGWVLRLFRGW
jgi:hypothetical protein